MARRSHDSSSSTATGESSDIEVKRPRVHGSSALETSISRRLSETGTSRAFSRKRKPQSTADLYMRRSIGWRQSCGLGFQEDFTQLQIKQSLNRDAICPLRVSGTLSVASSDDYSMILHHREVDVGCRRAYLEFLDGDDPDMQWNIHEVPMNSSFCSFKTDKSMILVAGGDSSQMILIMWNPGRDSHDHSVKGQKPHCCASSCFPDAEYMASFGDGPYAVLIDDISTHFSNQVFDFGNRVPSACGAYARRFSSDVLAQSFGYRPNLLFNGLRGGEIIAIDPRYCNANGLLYDLRPPLDFDVKQLVALKNEFHLLAGYQNPREIPKIYLWDIRYAVNPVLEYKTNCSEGRLSIGNAPNFTLNVDDGEHVLTSVLPDLRARFWSIRTGEMIRVYPEMNNTLHTVVAAGFTTNEEFNLRYNLEVPDTVRGGERDKFRAVFGPLASSYFAKAFFDIYPLLISTQAQ